MLLSLYYILLHVVTLNKMIQLAKASAFDTDGPELGATFDNQKVFALGEATKHDICVSTSSPRVVSGTSRVGDVTSGGICHAYAHDGRCVSLFKTLYTNMCSHQCTYCSNATCSTRQQTYSYTPHELCRVMLHLYKGNYVEGLFLSSGVGKDEDATMEEMVEAIRLLREHYNFAGYIHLKILPGTDKDLISRAMSYADRVSINIEVPFSSYMDEMSPTKDFKKDIIARQRMVQSLMKRQELPAGQTTQLVIGGAGENDVEIFRTMIREYEKLGLKRVYYSAFTPVEGTVLEDTPIQPLWREHRLYQVDWLYRLYRLRSHEIFEAFTDDGYLMNRDPKVVIAQKMLGDPLDPTTASYEELLRVPGIGPISASRIVSVRKSTHISTRMQLQALGVVIKRACPYISLGGWQNSLLDRWMT